MAKYRPYRTHKEINQRHLRMIALALIVIIVAAVILLKIVNQSNPPEYADGSQAVPIESILPGSGTQAPAGSTADPASKPQPALEKRVAPVQTQAVELLPAAGGTGILPVNHGQDGHATTAVADTPKPAVPIKPAPVSEPDKPIIETVQIAPVESALPADSGTTSPEAQGLIEKAMQLGEAGQIIATRDLLNHTLDLQLSAQVRGAVKNKLAKLAESWLFSREVYEGDKLTSYYLVQSGDLLAAIAKRYKVPYESVMRLNTIARPELLQAGQKIKVIQGPFNAVIYKGSFTMDLYLQNVYVKTYRVGLGKIEHETPAGRWRVKSGGKLISPKWTDPDTGRVYVGSAPDYPLGSRWIAIEGLDANTKDRTGFAIHGTKDPDTIGTRSSRGCIRLYNGDAIEVYNLFQEGVSEVLVVE